MTASGRLRPFVTVVTFPKRQPAMLSQTAGIGQKRTVAKNRNSSMSLSPQTNLDPGSVSEWPEIKTALAAELKDYANG